MEERFKGNMLLIEYSPIYLKYFTLTLTLTMGTVVSIFVKRKEHLPGYNSDEVLLVYINPYY